MPFAILVTRHMRGNMIQHGTSGSTTSAQRLWHVPVLLWKGSHGWPLSNVSRKLLELIEMATGNHVDADAWDKCQPLHVLLLSPVQCCQHSGGAGHPEKMREATPAPKKLQQAAGEGRPAGRGPVESWKLRRRRCTLAATV
jgi:hypothetical protein